MLKKRKKIAKKTSIYAIRYQQVGIKLSRRHIGHDEFIVNHRAMHFEWYSCKHGSTLICCPFLK